MGKTVLKFVNDYAKFANEQIKANAINGIMKKNVNVGFSAKVANARAIAEQTCMKNGKLHIDSPKRFLLTTLALLSNYTDLEIDPKNFTVEYDLLNEHGALEKIISSIDEKELSEFNTIIQMTCDDYIANHSSFQNWVMDSIQMLDPILTKLLSSENKDKTVGEVMTDVENTVNGFKEV